MNGYLIKGPNCGRDKNGIFRCECGKCQVIPPSEFDRIFRKINAVRKRWRQEGNYTAMK